MLKRCNHGAPLLLPSCRPTWQDMTYAVVPYLRASQNHTDRSMLTPEAVLQICSVGKLTSQHAIEHLTTIISVLCMIGIVHDWYCA